MFFLWTATALLLLLSAEKSSLQFTRDAVMGFSRGSERTVDIILPPRNVTKTVNRAFLMILSKQHSSTVSVVEVDARKVVDNITMTPMTMPSRDLRGYFSPLLNKNLPDKLLLAIVDNNGPWLILSSNLCQA